MWGALANIFSVTFALVFGLAMAEIIPMDVLMVYGLISIPVSILGIIRTWPSKGPKKK